MKATDIEPGRYYLVRLSGRGEHENVRCERVELAYPTQTDTKTKVMVATRHFALRDKTTRHLLRDVIQPSDPEVVAKTQRFLETRDRVLAEDGEA